MEGRKTLSGSKGYHRPVLLREVLEKLNVQHEGWYLDCTLGDGGHSLEILKHGGNVVGIDVDPEALKRASERFENSGIEEGRFRVIEGNFRDIKNLLQMDPPSQRLRRASLADLRFKGILFDLGVSSLQLESPERGFSFGKVGPLDMRMDPNLQVRALDLINVGGRKELYELFSKLGEEKFAKAISDTLVSSREVGSLEDRRWKIEGGIKSTKDLADLIEGVYRKHGVRHFRIHPATKVFQALRIAVNDELKALEEGLDQAIDLIEKNGKIIVISFHSLEDRIVKNAFREWKNRGFGEVITKKPITPGVDVINENPRSRSAKMRVFKRL